MISRMRLLLASSLLIGGCAAKDTSSIGQAESQQAGQSLQAEIESGAGGFGAVSSQGVLPTCVTLSGDVSDPDLDSIPTDATLTFNCSQTSLGYTGTVTGTEMVTDTEPSTPAWAFSATADLMASLTGPAGGSIVTHRTGSFTAAQASPLGPFSLDRTLTVTTVFTGAGGHSVTVDADHNWTITYAPQVSWTPGSVVATGSLTATGMWSVTMGSKSADAELSTPTPLTLDPTCASRVTAGVVTGSWTAGGHGNTITVTWTGCGAATVTYAPH
jgi:hypothetical protein